MSKINRANGRAAHKASRLMTSLNNDELGLMKLAGGLVDMDLPLEAQQWRNLTINSQIADERRRASAIFLGSDNVDQVEKSVPALMGKILLECLVSFVHSRGAKVAWSTRFSHEALNVAQQTVRINGEVRQFLSEGQLFIYSEFERVIVSAVTDNIYPPVVFIEIHSSLNSAAFFDEWEEYARANSYLRGQSFFADGEPIEPTESHTWDSIVLPDNSNACFRLPQGLGAAQGVGGKDPSRPDPRWAPGDGQDTAGKSARQYAGHIVHLGNASAHP